MSDLCPTHDATAFLATLCLVALAVFAAGCIGSDETSTETSPGAEPFEQASSNDSTIVRPASFPVEPVNRTTWANGSFSHEEVVVGQADRQQRAHRVSLDGLPENVPVRLEARLYYTAPTESTTGVDHADVFLDRELDADAEYPLYRVEREEAAESEHVHATFVADGSTTPELVVLGDVPPADAELSYTLRVQVRVADHVVPAEVATAVEVPADAERVQVLFADAGEPASLRAWEPDDGYEGRTETDDGALSVPTPDAGSYVVVPNATAAIRVVDGDGRALDAEGALQAVGWEEATGEPLTVPPSGSETWSGELTRAPLTVGFTIRSDNDQLWAIWETTVQMSGPSGDLPSVRCTACFSVGTLPVRAGFDDDHAAGTYELAVDATANGGTEVVPRWIHYER